MLTFCSSTPFDSRPHGVDHFSKRRALLGLRQPAAEATVEMGEGLGAAAEGAAEAAPIVPIE